MIVEIEFFNSPRSNFIIPGYFAKAGMVPFATLSTGLASYRNTKTRCHIISRGTSKPTYSRSERVTRHQFAG